MTCVSVQFDTHVNYYETLIDVFSVSLHQLFEAVKKILFAQVWSIVLIMRTK